MHDSLPCEEVRLTPTFEQLKGKGAMHKLSEERSDVPEYEQARFKVIVYVRETSSNGQGDIVTAPAPVKVIDKGMAGTSLLAHVVLSVMGLQLWGNLVSAASACSASIRCSHACSA